MLAMPAAAIARCDSLRCRRSRFFITTNSAGVPPAPSRSANRGSTVVVGVLVSDLGQGRVGVEAQLSQQGAGGPLPVGGQGLVGDDQRGQLQRRELREDLLVGEGDVLQGR